MLKKLLAIFFTIAGSSIVYNVYTTVSGQTGAYSGAPSESNCTSCHSGTVISSGGSGTNWDKISLKGNFTGNGYLPDSNYTVTLRYSETGKSRYGFLMTCLDEKTGKPCGTFTNLGGTSTKTKTSSTSVGGDTRLYVGHNGSTSNGTNDTGMWTFRWTAPNSNLGNVKFYVSLNVTNSNGSDAGDQIYTKSFTFNPSTLLPTAKAALADTHACQNMVTNFKVGSSTGSPTSYAWKFPGGTPSTSTSATPAVTYTLSGPYIAVLTVKNNKGVGQPDTFKFNVKTGAAVPLITPGGTSRICAGDSIQLSSSTSTNYTYKWSPYGQSGSKIFAKDSNVYSITGTAPNGCQRKSGNVTVLINKRPSLTLVRVVKKDSFCQGDNVDLIMLGAGPSDSFKTIPGNAFWDKTQTISANSSSVGKFTVEAYTKSAAGCVSPKQTYTYTIFAADAGPTGLSVSNVGYFGFRVNWSTLAGASGYKVSLDSGKTYITPSSGSTGLYHDITGLAPGKKLDVRVIATNNSPCGKTNYTSIVGTSTDCPNLNFTISGPTKVCSGTSVDLKVLGLKINSGTRILVDGISQGKDTIVKLGTVGFGKSVEITTVDSNALVCGTVKKTHTVSVDVLTISVDLKNTIDICQPVTSTYVLSSFNGNSNADSTRLIVNNVAKSAWIAGQVHNNVSVKNGDSVWTEIKKGVCSGQSQRKYMNFTGLLDAKFSNSNTGYNYTFTPNVSTGTHTWKVGSLPVNNTTAPTIDLTSIKGNIVKVLHTVDQTSTCMNTDSSLLNVRDLKIFNTLNQKIKVYPNPVSSELSIELQNPAEIQTLELVNAAGQLVYKAESITLKNSINTSKLAAGLYFVKLTSKTGSQTFPVTKE